MEIYADRGSESKPRKPCVSGQTGRLALERRPTELPLASWAQGATFIDIGGFVLYDSQTVP